MIEKIQKRFDVATAIVFVAILLTPLAGLFFRWDLHGGEADEKRTPAPLPHWSWQPSQLKAFPQRFDAWFRDHFGFRRLLIRTHSVISYFVLHTSPTAKVVLGKDGWFYYDGLSAHDGDPINQYRGAPPMTPYELERWRWMYQDISDWLTDRGIRYLLVIAPAKEMVYPENMPGCLRPLGPSANVQATTYFRRHGHFEFLDLTPHLQDARKEERLYHKTDTHWNAYGAYVGYREIINRLSAWYANLHAAPLADFKVWHHAYLAGDLAQMMDLRPDLTEDMVLVDPNQPRRASQRKIGQKDLPSIECEIPDPSLPHAVVFRDSFSEDLIPFLSEHFRRVLYVWGRVGFDLAPVLHEMPGLVMQITGDRVLGWSVRYPTRMQQYANKKRFATSTNVLARTGPFDAFAGIRALTSCSVEHRAADLVIVTTNNDAAVELPAVPGAETNLPIMRIDVTCSGWADATVVWTNARAVEATTELRYQVGAPLARGTNTVYLPLLDPETTGPLRLQFSQKGKYTLHRIEVRGVPRE